MWNCNIFQIISNYFITPIDIHVGGLIFYQGFFFFSPSDFRGCWTELNENRPPFPTNRESKKTFFGRLRNLTATLTAYIFEMKHDVKCVDNYKGFATLSQSDTNFGPQTTLNWTAIFTHPT